MNRLKAVMFDMDGVLIDSERISLNLWRQINEEWGNVFDVSVISQMMGGSPEENRRKYGHLLPPLEIYDQMRQQKMIRTRQLVEQQGMPLRPRVREMLATLKENGIRRLIVSSTPRENAEWFLQRAGIAEEFDDAIFADEAGRRKPHPDLYLAMMERQALKPQDCIIIEDSPNGVQAGYVAGVRVFGVEDTTPLRQFEGREAWQVVDSMEAVRRWVLQQLEKENQTRQPQG